MSYGQNIKNERPKNTPGLRVRQSDEYKRQQAEVVVEVEQEATPKKKTSKKKAVKSK